MPKQIRKGTKSHKPAPEAKEKNKRPIDDKMNAPITINWRLILSPNQPKDILPNMLVIGTIVAITLAMALSTPMLVE